MTLAQARLLSEAKRTCDAFDGLYPEPVDISRVRIYVTDLPFRWRWKNMGGLALGARTMVLHPDVSHSQQIVTHELVHIWQSQALGNFRQWWEYEIETRRKGYWDNFFEVEARFVAGQA